MRIQKICPQNFNGIYRISKTALQEGFDDIDDVIDIIRSKYAELMRDDIISMSGDTPFTEGVILEIDKTVEKTGYSDFWVRQNAQNHGLDLSKFNDDKILFITKRSDINEIFSVAAGKKSNYDGDIKKLEKYSKKLYNPAPSLRDIMNGFKFPSHLVNIAVQAETAIRKSKILEGKFHDRIFDANTRDELVEKMFSE